MPDLSKKYDQLLKLIKTILALTAIFYIVQLIIISFFRMSYPFELEWIEGGIADHVNRIINGQQLYNKPSLDFIAYIYTPLYYYVALPFFLLMGKTLVGLRLVSFASSLGIMWLIYLLVRTETSSRWAALIAAGLFAACFKLCGAWFDVARSDSLMLLLLLGSLLLIRSNQNRRNLILSGLILALAFLTKQPAILILPFVFIFLFLQVRWHSFYFVASSLVTIAISVFILSLINDGWFIYYTFQLPSGHEIEQAMFLDFWLKDMIGPLGIAIAIGLAFLFSSSLEKKSSQKYFLISTATGLIVISWLGRLHFGGWDNVLMPACAAITILFGIGLNMFINQNNRLIAFGLMIITLAQFYFLSYDPSAQLPTKADRESGERLLEVIEKIEGDVLMPYHGYLCTSVGKKSQFQNMAMIDVVRGDGLGSLELIEEIEQNLSLKKYGAVILNAPWYSDILEKYYYYDGSIFDNDSAFYPVTGFRTRPNHLFLPRPDTLRN